MDLSSFIKEIGDEAAAELFCAKVRTVASWRRGERLPASKKASHIIRVAAGKIDYAGIYGGQACKKAACDPPRCKAA